MALPPIVCAQTDSLHRDGAVVATMRTKGNLFLFGGLHSPLLSSATISQYSINAAEYAVESDLSNAQPAVWIGGGYRTAEDLEAGMILLYRGGEAKKGDTLTDAEIFGLTIDLYLAFDIVPTLTAGKEAPTPIELALGFGISVGSPPINLPVVPVYRLPRGQVERSEGTITPSEPDLFGVAFLLRGGYHITSSIVADLVVRWARYPDVQVDYREVHQRQGGASEGFGFSLDSRDLLVGIRYRF